MFKNLEQVTNTGTIIFIVVRVKFSSFIYEVFEIGFHLLEY